MAAGESGAPLLNRAEHTSPVAISGSGGGELRERPALS
jgi:hypothetical protein